MEGAAAGTAVVRVRTLGGMRHEVTVNLGSTVLDLKTELQAVTSVLRYFMKLAIGSRVLGDAEKISSLEDGARLDVTLTRITADHEEWLDKIAEDPSVLSTAPEEVCADRELVLAAIQAKPPHPGQLLSYAVPELRGDRELVLAALQALAMDKFKYRLRGKCPGSFAAQVFKWASPELLADRSFAFAALALTGDAFWCLHGELQAELEVITAATCSECDPMQWLEALNEFQGLRACREAVSAAVQQDGRALEIAALELKAEQEICLAAVSNFGDALRWAAPCVQRDPEVVEAAVREDGHALCWAAPLLKANKHIALLAVQQDASALHLVAEPLRADREVVLASVRTDGYALRWAAEALRADAGVVRVAVSSFGLALQWAAAELRADWEVVAAAVSNEGCALRHAAAALRADRELVRMAVAQDGWALRWAAPDLRSDADVVATALRQDGAALAHVDRESPNYEELAALAEEHMPEVDDYEGYTPRNSGVVGWSFDLPDW